MLIDQTLSEDEHAELLALLQEITGGEVPLKERVASYSAQLPLTWPAATIQSEGRYFCMTGKFVFGSRRRCHEAIEARGGVPQGAPTRQTHVLVIGAIGSTDWIHSTHGRKIEFAVGLQRQGLPIAIVTEE